MPPRASDPPARGARPSPEDRAPSSGPIVRILADDLTGALDTAAQFTGLIGPVPVSLGDAAPGSSLALDLATRDEPWDRAQRRIRALDGFFEGADIAYLKIDSLLRGHTLQDVAAWFRLPRTPRHCLLAPAFPAQGRVTCGGIQYASDPDGRRHPAGPPLPETLRALGLPARLLDPPEATELEVEGACMLVCDAQSEADLAAIACAGSGLAKRLGDGNLLWCGSAGLARAVAGSPPRVLLPPPGPVLIVVGSAHAVSRAQVRQFVGTWPEGIAEIDRAPTDVAPGIAAALQRRGVALVVFRPGGASHPAAMMDRIRTLLASVLPALPRPGTLVVSGGETLRAVCEVLGSHRLKVEGELGPGIPMARLVDGTWKGLAVISKSGAFGGPGILVEIAEAALLTASIGNCTASSRAEKSP